MRTLKRPIKAAFEAIVREYCKSGKWSIPAKVALLVTLREFRGESGAEGFVQRLQQETRIPTIEAEEWLALIEADAALDAAALRHLIRGKDPREIFNSRGLGFFISERRNTDLLLGFLNEQTIYGEILRLIGSASSPAPRLAFIADLAAYRESGWAEKDRLDGHLPEPALADFELLNTMAGQISGKFRALKKLDKSAIRLIVSPDGKLIAIPVIDPGLSPEDEREFVLCATRKVAHRSPLWPPLKYPDVEKVVVVKIL